MDTATGRRSFKRFCFARTARFCVVKNIVNFELRLFSVIDGIGGGRQFLCDAGGVNFGFAVVV